MGEKVRDKAVASKMHRPGTRVRERGLAHGCAARRGAEQSVAKQPDERLAGAVTGRLVALASSGIPSVEYPDSPDGLPMLARTTVSLAPDLVGRQVVLMFEGGDPRSPIILGVLRAPGEAHAAVPAPPAHDSATAVAEVDGRKVTFTAEQQVILQCGEASITLTRAGKILIRGAYVLSQSSGVHRIKGGSVQIN